MIKASGSHHLVILQERLSHVGTHLYPAFTSKLGGALRCYPGLGVTSALLGAFKQVA